VYSAYILSLAKCLDNLLDNVLFYLKSIPFSMPC